MWYDFDNITEVEAEINQTLIAAGEFPPTVAQVNARKVTLEGFQLNETTAAGIYRGRLSNLYQCVPLHVQATSPAEAALPALSARITYNLHGHRACCVLRVLISTIAHTPHVTCPTN